MAANRKKKYWGRRQTKQVPLAINEVKWRKSLQEFSSALYVMLLLSSLPVTSQATN